MTSVQLHQESFLQLIDFGENRKALSVTLRLEENNRCCFQSWQANCGVPRSYILGLVAISMLKNMEGKAKGGNYSFWIWEIYTMDTLFIKKKKW